MKIDPYAILIVLSVLVVLSYIFNYLARISKVPSVILLIASGIALKLAGEQMGFSLPQTQTLLELLGITGLIFIVLEASLDLNIERRKFKLIGEAFIAALILLIATSGSIAFIFSHYFDTDFKQALVHAIPLSVISSAIAIPSVSSMAEEKREFIVYESTFSDILGIIAFNYFIANNTSGLGALTGFSIDIISIILISFLSTLALVFLLDKATTHVRFFLTFAIIILAYSVAKYFHLPSLILVLCFGLVLGNLRHLNYPIFHRIFSLSKLTEVTKELKMMTVETAFIIRTFFFLLFGYSINLSLLTSQEVLLMGLAIITVTIVLRFIFLHVIRKESSAPLTLIAPRGLITVLLFYSIPGEHRMHQLSEGVLFVVIALTSVAMTIGLLLNKEKPSEKIEDLIR